jgi:hypothetical protein
MSFSFIHDFQMNLYRILASDKDISSKIDKIYLSVVQDAKYPFLLINMLQIDDISKFSQMIYSVTFEICIFARDKNHTISMMLADKITNKLSISHNYFKDYIVAGIKSQNITFARSQDLISSKLTIHYRVLLKKELLFV